MTALALMHRFRERHPGGLIGLTRSFAAMPTIKRDAVCTAVHLTHHERGFFNYRGDMYFWEIGESLDNEPLLLIGPIEDL